VDSTILRRLRGEPNVRKFATIDIETRKWVQPYAVGFYDGSRYVDFIDYTFTWQAVDKALDHVLQSEYAGYWIYAHNGGNFDFTFLLNRLIRQKKYRSRFTVDIIPIGSTVVTFTVTEVDPGVHRKGCSALVCRGCKAKRADNRDQKWVFVDSARLLPMALDEIGETFNVTRKVKLDMSYDELALVENRMTMQHYLKVDCISLYDGIHEVQKTINQLGGQLGITLPSTSLDLYRRAFQRDDVHTNRHYLGCPNHGVSLKKGVAQAKCPPKYAGFDEKGNPRVTHCCLHEFIREAYFGGRTEIYRMSFNPYYVPKSLPPWKSLTKFKHYERGFDYEDVVNYRDDKWGQWVRRANLYDINSHYPHCMLEPMPVGPAIEMEGLTEAQVYSNASRLVGMVNCDVYIPEDCYLPPLPVRKGGKLMFPVGKLHGTWDTAELALVAKVGGKILKTYKSVWFSTAPIFIRFIRQLYKFRDKKAPGYKKALDKLAKLLMNSLYGKWAMKVNRTKIVIRPSSPDGKKCINMEADVWAENTIVNPIYVLPQLSVHVTSVARARLWEINMKVLQDGGRIYYNDTDSLVCSGATLETGGDLGALKNEATIKRAVFALPKLYLVETDEPNTDKTKEPHLKIKSKGLGPGIRMPCKPECEKDHEHVVEGQQGDDPLDGQLSEKEFFDMVRRGVPIERHRITKLKEALNAYAKAATEFPRIISSPKAMQSAYDKRIILDDHNTKPLVVNMFA
jgi:hypothetical protein